MQFEYLKIDRHDDIATVTFNRPGKANALNFKMIAEIEAAALSFREDFRTRAVIFTGAGKHFSAGADLSDPGHGYDGTVLQRRRRRRIGERAIQALLEIDQITIAAWNGAAVGGGGCIAMALDFRVASDDCLLFFPEVDLGLNLMWRSMPLCVNLVGPARAKRLMAGGERVDGEILQQWGMLDDLVARPALLKRAQEMAAFYAGKPPVAAQMIKRSINAYATALDRPVMHLDSDQFLLAQSTDDHRIAAKAWGTGERPALTGN